jgi:hypothetical protein
MNIQIDSSLQETGRCAAASIVEMVAALECDYERLEELREERDTLTDELKATATNVDASETIKRLGDLNVEIAELETVAGECETRENAEQRIQEDALSVEVRSDWHVPGENNEPGEFCILLSTGGPASRIRGELDEHCEPRRAWLEVQDWGTPWTQYFDIEQDTLLTYARCFYFGEG